MKIEVVEGDVRTHQADVLILKYANGNHGADLAVSTVVGGPALVLPAGQYSFVPTKGRIPASEILALSVGRLQDFEYGQITAFAKRTLLIVCKERPNARSIAITIHGPGYGLDELAAVDSLVMGLMAATKEQPSILSTDDFKVSIVENNGRRAKRLREYFAASKMAKMPASEPDDAFSPKVASAISSNGTYAKRLFAAMPFHNDYLDHWELALQPAAHDNNVVIERLDHAHFTGEIVGEIRARIERSAAVVAVLDENNPNVFLEVGYAWGVKKPALLVLKEGQEAPFDVRSQRLIRYNRIGQLKASLSQELKGLLAETAI